MTKFKTGDNVRFIGDKRKFNRDVTFGNIYEIDEVDENGDALFFGDDGHDGYRSYISEDTEDMFELVESAPAITDILANLALRVSELEKTSPSVNGKLLRIYTGHDADDDFITHVTVGIDEATGVMYVLGMKTEVVE